jgi:CyaY protein
VISEAEYEERAAPELEALLAAVDELETDELEAELESDILTLEFADGTKYVINSHRAARQIWMAAERSAWHFDWEPEGQRWVAHKTGDELWSTIASKLQTKLGMPVELSPGS